MNVSLATGMRLMSYVLGAVHIVETIAIAIKGKQKQDAAVDAVRVMLPVVEGVAGKDLLNDKAVEDAIRGAIDAVVALQNVVTRKQQTDCVEVKP